MDARPADPKGQIQGRTKWRLFFASLLCGPLAGAGTLIILSVIIMLMNAGSTFNSGFPAPAMILGGMMWGAIIGWPAMVVFGLPVHAFLYKRKSHKIGGYMLASAIFSMALAVGIWLLVMGGGTFLAPEMMMGGGIIILILLLACVGAASLFWLIRRPDKDILPPEKLAATFE